jgi:hypothetical protein
MREKPAPAPGAVVVEQPIGPAERAEASYLVELSRAWRVDADRIVALGRQMDSRSHRA